MSDPQPRQPWGLWSRLRPLCERMSITLYGSYYPPSEMSFLKRQRDFLRNEGYALACLVKDGDGDGDGVTALEASKRYLENSDLNFLIFTRAGKRHGLIRELAHVADLSMRMKAADCVVFDQVVDGASSVPDLSMCDLGDAKIQHYEFRDEPELQIGLLTRAQDYVMRKRDILDRRPSR